MFPTILPVLFRPKCRYYNSTCSNRHVDASIPRNGLKKDIKMHLLTLTLTVASCGVAVLGEPAPPRDTIPFDYAWRFALAPGSAPAPPAPPPPPPPSPQPYPDCTKFNTTNAATCSGLHATASGDASAAACKAACCKEGGCTVYQYTEHPSPSCWTGTCLTPLRGPTAGWVSGSVPTGPLPPQPTPPAPPSKGCGAECAVGFPDDGWGLVDVPHDYIIPLPITNVRCIPQAAARVRGCVGAWVRGCAGACPFLRLHLRLRLRLRVCAFHCVVLLVV